MHAPHHEGNLATWSAHPWADDLLPALVQGILPGARPGVLQPKHVGDAQLTSQLQALQLPAQLPTMLPILFIVLQLPAVIMLVQLAHVVPIGWAVVGPAATTGLAAVGHWLLDMKLCLIHATLQSLLQFAEAHGAKQGEEHKPAAYEKRQGTADLLELEGPPNANWEVILISPAGTMAWIAEGLLSSALQPQQEWPLSDIGCSKWTYASFTSVQSLLEFAKAHGAKQGKEHKPAAHEKQQGTADLLDLEGPPKANWEVILISPTGTTAWIAEGLLFSALQPQSL